MRLCTIFLAALLVPQIGVAGGTLRTMELHPLMRQMPEVWAVSRSLTLSSMAYAEVRLGNHFAHLSGGRTGPYSIQATSRRTGKPLVLVLCTQVRFLDRGGRELSDDDMHQATELRETLTAIFLSQPQDAPLAVKC